ncbi:hypothetical protein [Pseudonocardia sp. H11422]|uniref:hypothetical protein n=1 Tax=Pseudonocardia sp. H11422 TaxID=2835866 RepID=UPI001BDD2EF0|nr:hypothetical protein [Pseudonocardia sp. H11422]
MRRRFVVLPGPVLVAALALSGAGAPHAAATVAVPIAPTMQVGFTQLDPQTQEDYRQGYGDGYRDGYRDGWKDAREGCNEKAKNFGMLPPGDRTEGYKAGYGKGYELSYGSGYRRYCEKKE